MSKIFTTQTFQGEIGARGDMLGYRDFGESERVGLASAE
jgi:hypothetical protein